MSGHASANHSFSESRAVAASKARRSSAFPSAASSRHFIPLLAEKRPGYLPGMNTDCIFEFPPEDPCCPAPAPDEDGIFDPGEDGRRVLALLRGGAPVLYLEGRAGSGKTNLLRWLRKRLHSAGRRVKVVAATGTAALQARGQTIHRLFSFPLRRIQKRDVLHNEFHHVLQKIDVLIIDECSMLRCDVLDAIDFSFRVHRRDSRPFGGVQIVLAGDPYQLPPVAPEEDRRSLRGQGYPSCWFFSAEVIRDSAPPQHCRLHASHRQRDPGWLDLLDRIRLGTLSAEDLGKLNARAGCAAAEGPPILTITALRAHARAINAAELARLPGPAAIYRGELSGEFRDGRCPVPVDLRLKRRARVMFARNDPAGWFANGTVAVVEKLAPDLVEVRLENGPMRGELIEVPRASWDESRNHYNRDTGEVTEHLTLMYRQYPLDLAWAATTHRVQGVTAPAIAVDFGERGAFQHGQTYTTLSRCPSYEGITLARPIRRAEIIVDGQVERFHSALESASEAW